ncbi:ABC transporter ATP-binding protein [Vagococcus sp. BWB3-3]|uniref:ABC transporter ATP-binding protein n=1 Tax=Vagococcus allomyrinae TaxID=2794353 RepID=A0A940P5I3_9ENTE|nr:ABC transporter ATP-binding protein [Vagococcus allomyrinae]MBP1040141.1 ABC transporter ATP-binding protein [Vagococcus allomyrinae]
MNESILVMNSVAKKFGKEEALKNISLTVHKGDIYGLIGRNGAGKTTIMKLITDLSKESSGGEISLLGTTKGTSGYQKSLQRTGAVIESPVAFNKLTAYQNMKIICIQKGIHNFSVIEETLEFVNLAQTGKKKFKNFSLGMKQRLGIAMALVNNPDFLILDEPINGLDPIAIIEFREILERINRERNTTIFISSHILTELYQVSNRFGFINDGQMIQELSKEEFDELVTEAIVVDVENPKAAVVVLKENQFKNIEVIGENKIRILDKHTPVKDINKLLVQNDILVNQIQKQENSLENYFTNLIKDAGGQ